MIKRSLLAKGLITGLLAGTAAAPAMAAAPLSMTVPSAMPLAAVGISEVACAPAPALVPAAPIVQSSHPLLGNVTAARIAKSDAVLGGQVSALERLRLAQAGASMPAAQAAVPVNSMSAAQRATCDSLSRRAPGPLATNATVMPRPAAVQSYGRFLGTERVRIGRTAFDASWKRVSDRELSRRDVRRAIGRTPSDREALLSRVNAWVNRNIAYRDDSAQFGTSDYWADARMTLRSRTGDCEDYAILKMQMLAAAGVAREDMMLTLARDTLRRNDHAVLLVKHNGAWVMLDMTNNKLAPAAADYGYRPIMSFAANQRFIHGTPVNQLPQQRRVRVAYAN